MNLHVLAEEQHISGRPARIPCEVQGKGLLTIDIGVLGVYVTYILYTTLIYEPLLFIECYKDNKIDFKTMAYSRLTIVHFMQ